MKKSKCLKNAHLWLNPLSPLAHLIMITPIMNLVVSLIKFQGIILMDLGYFLDLSNCLLAKLFTCFFVRKPIS